MCMRACARLCVVGAGRELQPGDQQEPLRVHGEERGVSTAEGPQLHRHRHDGGTRCRQFHFHFQLKMAS